MKKIRKIHLSSRIPARVSAFIIFLILSVVSVDAQYVIDFESENNGNKIFYAPAIVNLNGIDWELEQALIGSLPQDKKNGLRALRMRRLGTTPGRMEMQTDFTDGIATVQFELARFSAEVNQPDLLLQVSTNQGNSWNTVETFSVFPEELTTQNVVINVSGSARLRFITELNGTNQRRFNIDDIVVTAFDVAGPAANDVFVTTDINTSVTIDVLANDNEGAAPLDPSTLTFVGTIPDPATVGTFTTDGSGNVTFDPAPGFVGFAEVDYQICDDNGLCDTATIKVEVIDPGPIVNLFPSPGPGTLAFEDLWPGQGDFDFNDLVIDYQFEITSDASNKIEQVVGTFIIQAFGAGYQNGFGFQLSDAIDASDLTVTGSSITENYITLDANGTEAGQNAPTIIVFDNNYNEMQHPGVGIGVNTEPDAPYVQPATLTITIDFPAGKYSWNDLDIANFNPFLIVDQNRGREVHLPGYAPTALADLSLFGTVDDASDVSQGITYVTENNLPWAINIYEKFDYPIEKQDIIWVHLKFVEWAESGGVLFPDWFQNLPGYRNQALIYQIP